MSGCKKVHMPVCVGKIQVLVCVHAFVHLWVSKRGGGWGWGDCLSGVCINVLTCAPCAHRSIPNLTYEFKRD